ncbi:MAG TPA: FecR domain-containing protein [Planctomycetota bacterium]|nr:FecR domain-containing protein [Planctomycetota bacterium]
MSDDLERRLERMYRSWDDSARRVEAKWQSRPGAFRGARTVSGSPAAWLGAGVAAAAAILLLVLALRPDEKPVLGGAPAPVPVPGPEARRDSSPGLRVPPPAPDLPRAAPLPLPGPLPPPPAEPARQEPPPPPPRSPEPAPSTPRPASAAPTVVARAFAVLREIDGSFELADQGLRGKQKDVTVSAGDRLRAATTVKLGLAEDRFVLLAPRTVVEFRPEEKRLALSLEQGELLADLAGPGPDVRVVTKSCEVAPLGTVFAVRVVPGRTIVTVEKGRVEIRSARGKATLRAAESLQAAEDGSLGPPSTADFRSVAWARAHRAPELILYAEDFSKPGAWEGDIDKGVARAVARPGGAPILHLATDKPIFEVPVRGGVSIVCRADRASRLKVQIFAADVRTTYKVEVPVLRSSDWRTLVVAFDDFVSTDRSKAIGRPVPGAPISDLLLMYGDEEERGSFWVDAIKVTELRP